MRSFDPYLLLDRLIDWWTRPSWDAYYKGTEEVADHWRRQVKLVRADHGASIKKLRDTIDALSTEVARLREERDRLAVHLKDADNRMNKVRAAVLGCRDEIDYKEDTDS